MNKVAIFAAGCFWGVEETFRNLPGVSSTRVGYSGGTRENPIYEQVSSDATGHAEAVEMTYDPAKVSYEQLLEVFWDNHNPTTPNRQGVDIGSQYRSIIFYHDDEQRTAAEKSRNELETSGYWKDPIVTEIIASMPFYPAEDYHQKYLMKRGLNVC